MNLNVRTINFLEFNFISKAFFCLFFIQFFINSTQLNIGIWQDESPYSFTTNNIALARITSTNTVAGELPAELANENGADVATSIQLANLAGAISAMQAFK